MEELEETMEDLFADVHIPLSLENHKETKVHKESIKASPEEMVGLLKGINIVAKKLRISTEAGKGYRALTNISDHGGQEVLHLHFHLFGGEKVGKMVE